MSVLWAAGLGCLFYGSATVATGQWITLVADLLPLALALRTREGRP